MLLVWILERRKGKAWCNPILFCHLKGTNIYYSVMRCIGKEGVKAFFSSPFSAVWSKGIVQTKKCPIFAKQNRTLWRVRLPYMSAKSILP